MSLEYMFAQRVPSAPKLVDPFECGNVCAVNVGVVLPTLANSLALDIENHFPTVHI